MTEATTTAQGDDGTGPDLMKEALVHIDRARRSDFTRMEAVTNALAEDRAVLAASLFEARRFELQPVNFRGRHGSMWAHAMSPRMKAEFRI